MQNKEKVVVEMRKYQESIIATASLLNERQKRLYLATQARMLGRGGISLISNLSGMSRDTITTGLKEIQELQNTDPRSPDYLTLRTPQSITEDDNERIRKQGAGRKTVAERYPGVVDALRKIIAVSCTKGDPKNSVLMWISMSTRAIAEKLSKEGYPISHVKVVELLRAEGYSFQGNQKIKPVGPEHEKRGKQFQYINVTAGAYIHDGDPVIHVDCKKKELQEDLESKGAVSDEGNNTILVLDHDFPSTKEDKAPSDDLYDIAPTTGFANVAITSNTAQFAVDTIKQWWYEMGKETHPTAEHFYILYDGEAIDKKKTSQWQAELGKLAIELGIPIEVSYFPPGASKWSKVEHRMFSTVTRNWRGKPLETVSITVSSIGAATSMTGSAMQYMPDGTHYSKSIKTTDQEIAGVDIFYHQFLSDWNYTIVPKKHSGNDFADLKLQWL